MQTDAETEDVGEVEVYELDIETEVLRLSKLNTLNYLQKRKSSAKALDIPVVELDKAVKSLRSDTGKAAQGQSVDPDTIEPWPEPVIGAKVLNDVRAQLELYLVMSYEQITAVVLWIAHTHGAHLRVYTPRLHISSPERQCGKSRLVEVIAELVFNAVATINIKTATLFRLLDSHPLTLLMDEVDRTLGDNKELIGVLNSGHKKGGFAHRCVEPDFEPRKFCTFAPVLYSGIGRIDDTLADRAIPIRMDRKRVSQSVAEFRIDRLDDMHSVRSKLARFVKDNERTIKDAEPQVPSDLSDRQKDGWRVLLAVADAAGGEWPEAGRNAALVLHATGEYDDQTLDAMLLEDIWHAFEKRDADRLPSADIVEYLNAIEDHPWGEWRRGNGFSPHALARRLKAFGIGPNTMRISGQGTFKGYDKQSFKDAYERYVLGTNAQAHHQPPGLNRNTVTNGGASPKTDQSNRNTESGDVTVRNEQELQKSGECYGVTIQERVYGCPQQPEMLDIPPSLTGATANRW